MQHHNKVHVRKFRGIHDTQQLTTQRHKIIPLEVAARTEYSPQIRIPTIVAVLVIQATGALTASTWPITTNEILVFLLSLLIFLYSKISSNWRRKVRGPYVLYLYLSLSLAFRLSPRP